MKSSTPSDSASRAIAVMLLSVMLHGCSGSGANESEPTPDEPKFTVGNNGPEGDSGLTFGNIRYPLDAALGDIWGQQSDHYQIDFTLTNGNFTLETVMVNGEEHQMLVPAQVTAVVHASMYSPGSSFDYSSYAFVPDDDLSVALTGVGYFTNAVVGVDENFDGSVSENEKHRVIDGVIDFEGTLPSDIALYFSLSLSNGQNVTGEYTGLFDFTQR